MEGEVTITLTKDSFNPKQPVLWQIVEFCGRTGIVYKIGRGQDEDGPNIQLLIRGYKIYKWRWVNWIKLQWFKIRVKFNWV